MTDPSAVPATTARSRADAEKAIAGLLAEHEGGMQIKDVQDLRAVCRGCEWVGPWRQSTSPANDYHRAHVASVIAGYMADVWDEGFNDGAHYASADLSHATYSAKPPPNPYRDEGNQP